MPLAFCIFLVYWFYLVPFAPSPWCWLHFALDLSWIFSSKPSVCIQQRQLYLPFWSLLGSKSLALQEALMKLKSPASVRSDLDDTLATHSHSYLCIALLSLPQTSGVLGDFLASWAKASFPRYSPCYLPWWCSYPIGHFFIKRDLTCQALCDTSAGWQLLKKSRK